MHVNAAAAHLKLAQWPEAAKAASAALEAVPGHEKALLRRAAAYEELSDLERALADYEAVRTMLCFLPRMYPHFCACGSRRACRSALLHLLEVADLKRALAAGEHASKPHSI